MSMAVSDAVSRVLGLALDGVTMRQKVTADNISNVDTPVGANGNNVDLRKETLAAVQTQYQYQMLTRAVNDRFTRVRDSIGGA